MIEVINIPIEEIMPSVEGVLANQGIPGIESADERTLKMAKRAITDYVVFSKPMGIMSGITNSDFENVYWGEGDNEVDTPLDLIYPDASGLALFAVTLGEGITTGIQMYFNQNDFAAGSMLDAAASEGAERAADYAESLYREKLRQNSHALESVGVMRFSPGYCGWHVSGQKRLFEYLQPDKIGIELTGSFLMKPLKSVSGVIISGPLRIFEFEDNFRFCANCEDHSCLERIASLSEIRKITR
jgi:hypothetical protein